jgi:hypothetical protein
MQMNMKSAKRRGLLQPRQMPVSDNFFQTDIRLPEEYMANVQREPIMFGGLGRMNGFGNDPEFNQNLENLQTSGLYGGFGNMMSLSDGGFVKAIAVLGAGLALTGNLNVKKMDLKTVAMYGAGGAILYHALN